MVIAVAGSTGVVDVDVGTRQCGLLLPTSRDRVGEQAASESFRWLASGLRTDVVPGSALPELHPTTALYLYLRSARWGLEDYVSTPYRGVHSCMRRCIARWPAKRRHRAETPPFANLAQKNNCFYSHPDALFPSLAFVSAKYIASTIRDMPPVWRAGAKRRIGRAAPDMSAHAIAGRSLPIWPDRYDRFAGLLKPVRPRADGSLSLFPPYSQLFRRMAEHGVDCAGRALLSCMLSATLSWLRTVICARCGADRCCA